MAERSKPEIVSARVTAAEKAIIRAAATAEGLSMSELIHRATLEAARQRLRSDLDVREPVTT